METAAIIGGALGFVMLIVFFITASNVGSIKTLVEKNAEKKTHYSEYYDLGELREFQKKKQEAIEAYTAALFFVSRHIDGNPKDLAALKNKEKIKEKIALLEKSN